MKKIISFIALISYCSLIYWLSNQQSLPMPQVFSFQDKLEHAGAYAVMSLLAWQFFRHFYPQPLRQMTLVIIFCSLYGASDEWHQSFVEGRNSDVLDWLADTIGAALTMLLLYYWKLKSVKRSLATRELSKS